MKAPCLFVSWDPLSYFSFLSLVWYLELGVSLRIHELPALVPCQDFRCVMLCLAWPGSFVLKSIQCSVQRRWFCSFGISESFLLTADSWNWRGSWGQVRSLLSRVSHWNLSRFRAENPVKSSHTHTKKSCLFSLFNMPSAQYWPPRWFTNYLLAEVLMSLQIAQTICFILSSPGVPSRSQLHGWFVDCGLRSLRSLF